MKTVQYTIRNIPEDVDKVMRKRARLSGKSLNRTLVEQLSRGVSLKPGQDAFDTLYGAGGLDKAVLESLAAQRKPDPKLWP